MPCFRCWTARTFWGIRTRFALIPSTSPASKDFRPREYWRGPVWPVLNWLFSWAFARRGWSERALLLRQEGLRQAAGGNFAEYYEPFTGEPLGSMQQSWSPRRCWTGSVSPRLPRCRSAARAA